MLKQFLLNQTNKTQYLIAALVILIVAGIGTYVLTSSHASTPYASVTSDSGTLASGAVKQTCSGSSDGSCVNFLGSSASWLPTANWYASDSAWNTPIPAGTPWAPSTTQTGFDTSCISGTSVACTSPVEGGVPSVYYANLTGPNAIPLVPLTINYPTCDAKQVMLPIPQGAITGWDLRKGDVENELVVMDNNSDEEIDIYDASAPGDTPDTQQYGPSTGCPSTASLGFQASIYSVWTTGPSGETSQGGWQSDGTGVSSRAAGVLTGTGLIRPRDTAATTATSWDHALAFTYPAVLNQVVLPGDPSNSDGAPCTSNECVPDGARLQLDPSFNCTATGNGLTLLWQQQMCLTLQKYGAIVIDQCGGLGNQCGGFEAEDPEVLQQTTIPSTGGAAIDGGGDYTYPFYTNGTPFPSSMAQYFHFVDWTKWTGAPNEINTPTSSGG